MRLRFRMANLFNTHLNLKILPHTFLTQIFNLNRYQLFSVFTKKKIAKQFL